MTGTPTDVNADRDHPADVGIIMFVTAGAILIACLFVSAVVMAISAVVLTATGPASLLDNFEIVDEIARPYIIIVSAGAVYVSYLLVLWSFHSSLGKISLYIFIAIGGFAIPSAVSTAHYFNYERSPNSYVISPEKVPELRQLAAASLRRTRAELQTLRNARALVEQLLGRQTSLPATLTFIDGPARPEVCSRLDLGSQTGALCVRRRIIVPPIANNPRDQLPIIEQPEILLNPDLRVSEASLKLDDLFYTRGFRCPVLSAIHRSNDGVDTERLFRCLRVATRSIAAKAENRRRELERAVRHPQMSYWMVFLDSVAGIVDADYSVLEPVSPLAGFISVTGSLLTLVYFAVFASLILEAVSTQDRVPRAGATEPFDPTPRRDP